MSRLEPLHLRIITAYELPCIATENSLFFHRYSLFFCAGNFAV